MLPNIESVNLGYHSSTPVPFAIGMPFYGHHTGDAEGSHNNTNSCERDYLAIGIRKDESNSRAFIVHTQHLTPAYRCSHEIHLDSGRQNIDWTAVAQLAGWRQGTSSLGTVMGVSPAGTRIAAATWKQVLIWTLDPRILGTADYSQYFPEKDFNARKYIGRLRPIALPSAHVTHRLKWTDEQTLCAITDRGLIRWKVGARASGARGALLLAAN